MTPSRSPNRHSFQKESYVARCEKSGKAPDPSTMDMFDGILEKNSSKWSDPESSKNNLEWDLVTTDWILEKARSSESYSQNIYAALCNNEFIKLDVVPILTGQRWGCSWRYAGGIVADMRQSGDYIDWYCSGIFDQTGNDRRSGFVPEGMITDEIREDFLRLGWIPSDDTN